MTIQTDIQWEITDTFAGDANYSWVRRGTIKTKPGENFSDLAAVRRVKREIGLSAYPCKTYKYGNMIELRPIGLLQVCFITFHSFVSAS